MKFLIFLISLSIVAPSVAEFRFGLVAYHVPFDSYKLVEEDFDRIAENGIGWISVDFAWRDIEKERGTYDFSYYDLVVESADKRGIKILAKVGNGYNGIRPVVPDWTEELSNGEYNEALGAYAEAVAGRYGKSIDYYAIENEPNVANLHKLLNWRVGDWDKDRIAGILKTLERSIREGDESSKIVLSVSVAPGWTEWIEDMSREVDFEVIGLQPYPCIIFPDPENAFNIIPDIEKALAFGKEVMVIETGYHTYQRSEEAQAQYIENICIAAMNAGATGVFFYEYMDNSEEFPEQEKHFGLLKENREPKLAWEKYGKIIESAEELQSEEVDVGGELFSDLYASRMFGRAFNLAVDILSGSRVLSSLSRRIMNSELTYKIMGFLSL